MDWSQNEHLWVKGLFIPKAPREKIQAVLRNKDVKDVETVLALCIDNHAYDEPLWASYSIQRMDVTKRWIDRHPPFVHRLLKATVGKYRFRFTRPALPLFVFVYIPFATCKQRFLRTETASSDKRLPQLVIPSSVSSLFAVCVQLYLALMGQYAV